ARRVDAEGQHRARNRPRCGDRGGRRELRAHLVRGLRTRRGRGLRRRAHRQPQPHGPRGAPPPRARRRKPRRGGAAPVAGPAGGGGAVAWLFGRKGVIRVDGSADEDELTLAAADGGAEDVQREGSSYEVTCAPEDLHGVRESLEAAGIEVQEVEATMLPKTTV